MSTTRRVALGNKLYRAVVTSIRTNGVTYTEHAGPYDKPGPAKAFVTRWTGPDNIWGGVHEISGHVEVGDVTWRRLDAEPEAADQRAVVRAIAEVIRAEDGARTLHEGRLPRPEELAEAIVAGLPYEVWRLVPSLRDAYQAGQADGRTH